MKRDVPWSSTLSRLDRRYGGWQQASGAGVEPKNEDPIEALIGHEHEPAGGVKRRMMWVRARLLASVGTGFACERGATHECSKRPIVCQRQHRHGPGGIVRRHKEPPRRVDRQMDW